MTQPSRFIHRPFTRLPMIVRLLVINMINSNNGGVEKPWITPAKTSAFIGLKPKKFIPTATIVKAVIVE